MTLHDIDRPLNKRGRKDAPVMGARLAGRGLQPNLIISSPAVRALKTAGRLAKQVGCPRRDISIENDIYGASVESLLGIVRGCDNGCNMVMMVGHNPEMTLLANMLGCLDINNVPTCGIVELDFEITTWKDVGRKKGELAFFDYPRNADNQDVD